MKNIKELNAIAALCLLLAGGAGCAQTSHPSIPAPHGALETAPRTRLAWRDVEASLSQPGPLRFKKIVVADWAVDRSGLINLRHPKAKAAHLEDGAEPIQIYIYEIEHPKFGGYLVDSGIARSVAEKNRKEMPVRFPVGAALPVDELQVHLDTKSYVESRSTPLRGVFLTHLHLDHILGLTDIPKDVPLYVGPGEVSDTRFTHLLVRPTTNLNLKGFGPLRVFETQEADDAPLDFVDIFGDGSMLGLHIPGHTKGNMAFIVRSTDGPRLLVGDGSHTDWGWEHGVEPGTFNTDGEQASASLLALKALAARHANLEVHLGHQHHGGTEVAQLH